MRGSPSDGGGQVTGGEAVHDGGGGGDGPESGPGDGHSIGKESDALLDGGGVILGEDDWEKGEKEEQQGGHHRERSLKRGHSDESGEKE